MPRICLLLLVCLLASQGTLPSNEIKGTVRHLFQTAEVCATVINRKMVERKAICLKTNVATLADEIHVSGKFTVGEGGSTDDLSPEPESPLFNLPSMRIAREYLRRQTKGDKQLQFT